MFGALGEFALGEGPVIPGARLQGLIKTQVNNRAGPTLNTAISTTSKSVAKAFSPGGVSLPVRVKAVVKGAGVVMPGIPLFAQLFAKASGYSLLRIARLIQSQRLPLFTEAKGFFWPGTGGEIETVEPPAPVLTHISGIILTGARGRGATIRIVEAVGIGALGELALGEIKIDG